MELSPQAIKDFQKLWLTEYGGQISDEEAHARGLALLALCKTVGKTIREVGNSEKNEKTA